MKFTGFFNDTRQQLLPRKISWKFRKFSSKKHYCNTVLASHFAVHWWNTCLHLILWLLGWNFFPSSSFTISDFIFQIFSNLFGITDINNRKKNIWEEELKINYKRVGPKVVCCVIDQINTRKFFKADQPGNFISEPQAIFSKKNGVAFLQSQYRVIALFYGRSRCSVLMRFLANPIVHSYFWKTKWKCRNVVIVVDFCSISEPVIYCFVGILAGKEAKKQSSKIQTLATTLLPWFNAQVAAGF